MASVGRFRPSAKGIAELARTDDMRAARHEAGEAVATNVRSQGIRVEHEPGDVELPVIVSEDGAVTIAHPSGEAVQAKHGALSKAAAEAGLNFNG